MLHLHPATDLATLADDLGDLLAARLADPMQAEWVAVPSAGVRHWLKLRLAERLGASDGAIDGVAANIEMPFPGRLRAEVLAAAGGRAADADPWGIDRLVWAVTAAADSVDGLPSSLLPRHARTVQSGGDIPAPRYPAARHVADLFDRYSVHRPEMVRAWASGDDVGAAGEPIPAHLRWQPRLWRAVRDVVGIPSPAEVMPDVLNAVRSGELDLDLPERLSVFGLSTLPGGADFLDLASAVAATREVHLHMVRASAGVDAVAERICQRAAPGPSGRRARSEVRPVEEHRHPLLTSWGGPHLEGAVLLHDAGLAGEVAGESAAASAEEVESNHLLARIQADIRADRAPHADVVVADDGDDSVQFHACQGPTRQVEVLRDVICHLLADPGASERAPIEPGRPPIEEDDIVVICPDLERFAPVIQAVFGDSEVTGWRGPPRLVGSEAGADGAGSAPRLRYRLADRAPTAANPVVSAVNQVLAVVADRFTASSVVDLLAMPAVRERSGLEDNEVGQASEWVADTRIRWGRDAAHRAEWGVGPDTSEEDSDMAGAESDLLDSRANTWEAGISRLLAGMAVSTREPVVASGSVAPVQVEGSETAVLGAFTDYLWRLERLADLVGGTRTVAAWADLLLAHLDGLVSAPADSPWQMDRVVETISGIAESASDHSDVELDFTEIRRVLVDRFDEIPGSSRFFRGGITFTSAAPLRWVPWRVVVLLGMDQSALTVGGVDGDDLLADEPAVGDREQRADARQFILEALLSAVDHFVVVRDGRDVLTNHEVPAAVPVAELQSVVDATVVGGLPERSSPNEPRSHPEEILHPRQPWAERALGPGRVIHGRTTSFDQAARRAALRKQERTAEFITFAHDPLPDDPIEVVSIDDLRNCLVAPIKHFLTKRLEIRLAEGADALEDDLPTTTSGLDRYGICTELLSDLNSAGVAPDDKEGTRRIVSSWKQRERLLGRVPAGILGERDRNGGLDVLAGQVEKLRSAADKAGVRPWLGAAPDVVDIDVEVGGIRVVGSINCVLPSDMPGPGTVRHVRFKPGDRIAAAVDLLALTLSDPERQWRWVAARRDGKGLNAVLEDPAAAREAMETALDLYRRVMREPLPIFADLSHILATGEGSLGAAWPGSFPDQAETAVYGDLDVTDLLAIEVRDHDAAPPGTSRVRHYANVLWHDVVRIKDAAEVSD